MCAVTLVARQGGTFLVRPASEGPPSQPCGPCYVLFSDHKASGHSAWAFAWGEYRIVVCIVDRQRSGRCDLVSGSVQLHDLTEFHVTCELDGRAASQEVPGRCELVVTGPDPCAMS